MEKKVFDILPPRKLRRKKIEELLSGKKLTFGFKRPEVRIFPPPFKKSLLIILLILIIAGGVIIGLNFSRAEIEIWPETEVLTFKTKIAVNKEAETIDFLNKVIPGKIFETEKTITEEFLSSGQVVREKKAEGVIRIYNNYHLPQVLVANTRFQPPSEKFQPPLEENENPWFRILERITIPSKSYKEVKVIADSPGEKYNIGPSIFSIPGLAGSPRYTLVYGESFKPMTGGERKELPQVTQEDLEQAEEILVKKITEVCLASLKNKIPAEFDFLEKASKTEIVETFSLARPGAELEKFSYQVKSKSQALVFKTSDIENFALEFILPQIPQQKRIDRESLKVNYSPVSSDLESGKITLSLDIEAKIYSPLDQTSLKKGLQGKSLTETKIFLENQPQIRKVQVQLWPFWVEKIPKDIEKIEIKLNLD